MTVVDSFSCVAVLRLTAFGYRIGLGKYLLYSVICRPGVLWVSWYGFSDVSVPVLGGMLSLCINRGVSPLVNAACIVLFVAYFLLL